jgi:hypothetical protein
LSIFDTQPQVNAGGLNLLFRDLFAGLNPPAGD